jgi:small-conductance mechanosensitive channel
VTTLFAADTARQAVVPSGLTVADWVGAGVILAVGVAGSVLLRKGLRRSLHRGDSERVASDVLTKVVGWVVVSATVFWSLSVLGVRLGPLFGALGIGGLAVAFAAQSILANFLASIILQVRRPFRRGDQISTNDCEGVVEEVNFRTVRLRTYAGERVMVPCADVLSNPITNHTTLGRRRTTLDIGVGYDTDLEECRRVLLHAAHTAEGVHEKPPPEVWVEEFGESAVNLAVRFWHAPDVASLWRVRSAVAIAAKQALDGAGIEIPFPQRVLTFASTPEPTANGADSTSAPEAQRR